MSVLPELVLKEAALLVVLGLLGSGFAAHLRSEDRPGARVALAPAFGLAVATAVLMVVDLVTPLEHAFWFVLVPGMALSLIVARRALRRHGVARPARRELVALGVVVAAALTVFNLPLVARDSVGPIGYGIFDAPGYIAFIDGFAHARDETPLLKTGPADFRERRYDRVAWGAPWDVSLRYGWGFKWQHTASDTVPAALSGVGMTPWRSLSAFMVALIAIGAMGTYALARALGAGRRRLWPPVLAGVLYAGPLLLQVFADGSQGLLAGVALFPALLTVGTSALRAPAWRTTVLLGLLLAGLQAVYPELLPLVAGAVILAVLVRAGALLRRRRLRLDAVRTAAAHLAALAGLALVLSPRTAPWTLTYVTSQFKPNSLVGFDSLIHYNMRADFLPGWVFQTREFYSFAFTFPSGLRQQLWALAVPGLLAAAIVAGLVLVPRARVLLAVVGFAVIQAYAATRTVDCSYCVQRTLFALAPVVPALLAVGLAALLAVRRRELRAAALVLTGLMAVAVLHTYYQVEHRVTTSAYMSSPELRRIAGDASGLRGPINLEGFDATPLWSWGDGRTAFNAMKASTGQRISMPGERHQYGGFAYVDPRPRGHPVYTPRYSSVLSRFGALDTGRQVLARRGPFVLARRALPFDVSVVAGVAVDIPARDPVGVPWVQPPGSQMGFHQDPLTFWVAAQTAAPATVRLELTGPPAVRLTGPPALRQRTIGGVLRACVPLAGPAGLRVLTLGVQPDPPPLQAPPEAYQAPLPAKLVRLRSVRATLQPCGGRSRQPGLAALRRNASASRSAAGVPIS